MTDLSYSTLPVAAATNNASDVITPLNEVKAYVNGSDWVDAARITPATITSTELSATTNGQLGLTDSSVRRGKCVIATSENVTSTSYTTLTTPDRIQSVVLPTDGLLFVAYQATVTQSVNGAARAAIFLGSNQLKLANGASAPAVTEASWSTTTAVSLSSCPTGLAGASVGAAYSGGDVTTGQVVGVNASSTGPVAGICAIFAAAGTYDISVQFKSTSGSVTASSRKLWVWTMGF